MATRLQSLLPLVSLALSLTRCGAAPEAPGATASADAPPPALAAVALRCERMVAPLGIGERRPRLSWQAQALPDARPSARRVAAWRVVAASSPDAFASGCFDRFDSGRQAGDATSHVWGGAPLPSGAEVWWNVLLWDDRGVPAVIGPPARFTVGVLDDPGASDWSAEWIGAADAATAPRTVSPWLVTDVVLPAGARRVRAWVASLGSHQLWIDGRRWPIAAGEIEFAPGMVDFSRRTRTVAYELDCGAAGLELAAGPHRLGLWLHSGFARHAPFHVAAHPLACAQFEFELADGRRVAVTTGRDWRAAPSSITAGDGFEPGDYGGDRIDAARDALPWCAAHDETAAIDWQTVARYAPAIERCALQCPPDRRRNRLAAVAFEALPAHDGAPAGWRIDFGRAFAGQIEVPLRGAAGATVTLAFSERREEEASWGQRGELRLDGDGRGTYANRFTPWAGRWLAVRGAAAPPVLADCRAWLVRPDFEETRVFACSDAPIARLDAAATWTWQCLVQGGAPQDCPHRERFGYGGDAHATMALGLGRFDSAAMYTRWSDDWAALQAADGDLPFSCPTWTGAGGPAWSGIVVQLAWEQWVRTADREALARAWPTIARWLDHLETLTRDGLLEPDAAPKWMPREAAWLDDWLAPGSAPRASRFDDKSAFFQNAYRVGCVRRAAELARALLLDEEAATLSRRGDELAAAVHDRFWNETRGGYVSRATVNVLLALFAELGDAPLREQLFARLVARLEAGGSIDTGLHGTWLLVRELLARGRADLLLALARQEGVPSFQGLLAGDATTLGETWDGRYSRIHACWLSIGALATEGVLGIRPRLSAPGYREFDVAPLLDAGIAQASGGVATPQGEVTVRWAPSATGDAEPRGCTLHVAVPLGATAHLVVPLREGERLQRRVAHAAPAVPPRGSEPKDATVERRGDALRDRERRAGRAELELGAGDHEFVIAAGGD